MSMVKINKMEVLAQETEGKCITEYQGERYQNLFESLLRICKDKLCRLNKFMNVASTTLSVNTFSKENGEMKWKIELSGDVSYVAGKGQTEDEVIDMFGLLLASDAHIKAVNELIDNMENLAKIKVFCELNAEVTVEGIQSDMFIPLVKVRSYAL